MPTSKLQKNKNRYITLFLATLLALQSILVIFLFKQKVSEKAEYSHTNVQQTQTDKNDSYISLSPADQVGWTTADTPLLSISYPPEWKSYEYTGGGSIGLCPKDSCDDAHVWIEVKPHTSVADELDTAQRFWYFKKRGSVTFPVKIASINATAIGFEKDTEGKRLTSQDPVFLYLQKEDSVLEIGYDSTDPLHQQIISTLIIH